MSALPSDELSLNHASLTKEFEPRGAGVASPINRCQSRSQPAARGAAMPDHNIREMLDGMCRAAEAFDGRKFASYFTEDGVYHDDFYGEFAGRERVAELINQWFFKHARDMRWDML